MKPYLVPALVIIAAVLPNPAHAQDSFKTRLAPVPIDERLAPVIKGRGSVSVTLSGSKLTITGTFEGMRSPATGARLLQSKMTGIRGDAIQDLTVSKAASGDISGAVNLTPPQV